MHLDKAKSYNETNCMQRKDADDTLFEYSNKIKWLTNGGDSILHVGSRSGDVLFDYVLPILPKNFKRVVGIDVSEAMISYATENFGHPKLVFDRADIINQSDVNKLIHKHGQFDHVTSLCSLHWVMDQELAFKNIFDLLTPDGDILMTMCQDHPLYEHYRDTMALEKWSDYREQMKLSTSPYFGSTDPVKMLKEILEKAGFKYVHVELKERLYHYDKQVFIDSTVPVAPFLDKISEPLKDEFLQIYINKVMTMQLPSPYKPNKARNDGKTIVPFSMLVAYARKSSAEDSRA